MKDFGLWIAIVLFGILCGLYGAGIANCPGWPCTVHFGSKP